MIDHGKFGIHELSLSENPFLLKLRDRYYAHQHRFPAGLAAGVLQRDLIAESQGLLTVHRICVSTGDLYRISDLVAPIHVFQKVYPFI